jgi:hypothetical protein
MTVDELMAKWSGLPDPAAQGEFTGFRVPGTQHELAIWIARDGAGRRHLLVGIPEGGPPLRQRPTRALEVTTDKLRVGDAPAATYIDLACIDPLHERTFAAVARDVIGAIGGSAGERRDAIQHTLERWRSFWSVDPAGLSREAALGLFGELWFMRRWMEPLPVSLVRWQGPAGARHDFQWETASIEVKTASSIKGPVIHWIANLDQLADPVTGTLHLFSLQVADDMLSANTLPGLVDGIEHLLAGNEEASRLFVERVGQAGYSPAHVDRYNRPLRIVAEELFRVDANFPRLTRASFPVGLPPGVDSVSYCLSIAACAAWRIASSPLSPEAAFLRA